MRSLCAGRIFFPDTGTGRSKPRKSLRDGWFHTGDQGEMDAAGNWRIVGRIKNLIILGSGHNIAPEPIEDEIAQHLPEAQQVVVVGNGRGYLSAIVTGRLSRRASAGCARRRESRSSALQAGAGVLSFSRSHSRSIVDC